MINTDDKHLRQLLAEARSLLRDAEQGELGDGFRPACRELCDDITELLGDKFDYDTGEQSAS